MPKDAIYLEGVTVNFDGFKALNKVNFIMSEGELRFLIGPNGAGKTTLLDVICGKVSAAEGRVFYDDSVEIEETPPFKIAQMGISRKFQAPSIFGNMSVWENLELALPKNQTLLGSLFHQLSNEDLEKINRILELINLTDQKFQEAGLLSHGQKQWLEIGMTLIQEPKVLLVDEPVAGMTKNERDRTGEILKTISKKRSVLVVEHDMSFVEKFSQTVTVLHEGKVICEGDYQKVSSDPRVLEVYLGREGEE